MIGRPGCGKSVVYRILEEELRARGYGGELKRIDDFPFLKHIFDTDVEHKRHRPAPGGGVKIIDDTVWDDLARALNQEALKLQSPSRLLFIEFSRDNYRRAFKHFDPELIRGSLIVYIDCPWDMCWERNVRRVKLGKGLDAHLVSREEMEITYKYDDYGELSKHIGAPMLVVRNDSDDLEKLRGELQKVIEKLKAMSKGYFKN